MAVVPIVVVLPNSLMKIASSCIMLDTLSCLYFRGILLQV